MVSVIFLQVSGTDGVPHPGLEGPQRSDAVSAVRERLQHGWVPGADPLPVSSCLFPLPGHGSREKVQILR